MAESINEDDDASLADEYDLADLGEWGDWVTHVSEVNALLQNESPRGAAVLARAYLEDSLDSALLTAAIHDPRRRRELVQAAAGDFPVKIAAWVEYAQLSKRLNAQMLAIRDVGNAFAHRPRAQSFDDVGIASLMNKLARSTAEEGSPGFPPPAVGVMTIALALHDCLANVVGTTVLRRARDRSP